ncbi:MAG: hypothetical protein ACLSVG_04175 [Clostridia bacterium]
MNGILSQEALNFQPAKKALFDLLNAQFDCCEPDRSGVVEYINDCKSIDAVDVSLFKVILSEIQIDANGTVALRFANNAVISLEGSEEHE